MKSENKGYVKVYGHVISVVLAICAAIVTIVFVSMLIIFIEFAETLRNFGYVLVESIVILFLATTPCYFICRKNPDNVWYVSIIINLAVLMISSIMLTGTWNLNAKITLLIISILLASSLSTLGAKKGRQIRKSVQNNQ